ncbi:hypothetical protein N2152v2_007211 [Parachlorella kessleri]
MGLEAHQLGLQNGTLRSHPPSGSRPAGVSSRKLQQNTASLAGGATATGSLNSLSETDGLTIAGPGGAFADGNAASTAAGLAFPSSAASFLNVAASTPNSFITSLNNAFGTGTAALTTSRGTVQAIPGAVAGNGFSQGLGTLTAGQNTLTFGQVLG